MGLYNDMGVEQALLISTRSRDLALRTGGRCGGRLDVVVAESAAGSTGAGALSLDPDAAGAPAGA